MPTLVELCKLVKSKNITGYSKMRKFELIGLLNLPQEPMKNKSKKGRLH